MVPERQKASWVTRSITICSEDVTVVARRRSTPAAAGTDNAGGGGGGNAGNLAELDRQEIPDVSNAAWAAAWNLEYSGFAGSASSGGGRGGYTFNSSTRMRFHSDPSIVPGAATSVRNNGGMGGRPLDYSTAGFSSAAAGFWRSRTIQREVRAVMAADSRVITHSEMSAGPGDPRQRQQWREHVDEQCGTDGAGGGGAGSYRDIEAGGTVSGVSISANGGNGGNQVVTSTRSRSGRSGGGGGGGYIGIGSDAPTCTANGRRTGTTNSSSMTEFPPNSATRGGAGLPNETVTRLQVHLYSAGYLSGQHGHDQCRHQRYTAGNHFLPMDHTSRWRSADGFSGVSYHTATFATDTFYAAVCPGH